MLSRISRQAPARMRSERPIDDDRVGQGPAGEPDDRGGAEGADRAERVAQDVKVGAAGVEAALARAVQQRQADQVHDQPRRGDGQEEPGPDRLGVLDPLDRLDHDPAGDAEQRRAVHQRGQDLPAEVAVGLGVVGRPLGDPRREQAEGQRADVGEHVPRVGQQRQRAAEPAADGLDHHEGAGEPQHQPQAGHGGRRAWVRWAQSARRGGAGMGEI